MKRSRRHKNGLFTVLLRSRTRGHARVLMIVVVLAIGALFALNVGAMLMRISP